MDRPFESLDDFRDVMDRVSNLTREQLYALVAGSSSGAPDWEEIRQTVGDVAFKLSWLEHELNPAWQPLERITPTTAEVEADPRWQRAMQNWIKNGQINFEKTDPEPGPPAVGRPTRSATPIEL